jgi:hypothetical protein
LPPSIRASASPPLASALLRMLEYILAIRFPVFVHRLYTGAARRKHKSTNI